MEHGSGDGKSLSEKTRKTWSAISQKFGCLFGKSSANSKKNNCLSEIGPQHINDISSQPFSEGDFSLPDDWFATPPQLPRYDPSTFCPGCDLNFSVNVESDATECHRIHEAAITVPSQSIENCRVDDGAYPWKIFRIMPDEAESELAQLVGKLLYKAYCATLFPYEHGRKENLSQVFVAVSKTEPNKVMGYCVVSRVKWHLDVAGVFDKGCVTEILSDHVVITYFWVHKPNRRQGVATSMVDAARKHFFSNSTIPKEKFGITSPTCFGSAFEEHYFGQTRNDRMACECS